MNAPKRKVAVVTGGTKGIGRACCLHLASRGFDISFSYHSDEVAAASLLQQLREHGVGAEGYRGDLAAPDVPVRFVAEIMKRFGRIDVLVNNAAVAPVVSIEEISIAEWDRVLNTNLRAAFVCAQSVLGAMKQQGGGRIIFLSSQAGQAGGAFIGAHYVASKAALLGLTKSFAKAGAEFGVLCNCVSPGQIDTPLTAAFPAEKVRALTAQIPMRRMGYAEEVATVVGFLASPEASYITGATIPVNGGLLMT